MTDAGQNDNRDQEAIETLELEKFAIDSIEENVLLVSTVNLTIDVGFAPSLDMDRIHVEKLEMLEMVRE